MKKVPTKVTMEFTPEGASVKVLGEGDQPIAERLFRQESRGRTSHQSSEFLELMGDSEFAETMDEEIAFLPNTICGLLWRATR